MSTAPSDFGLPKKFSRWYPGQETALLYALCSDTRFTILNAPTGIGKSAIYMAIASVFGGRTAILTSARLLQTQLVNDFSSMGLVKVMGQQNYPCLYFEEHELPGKTRIGRRGSLPGCEQGPCHAGIECEFRDLGCKYYDAVRTSTRKQYASFNYRYWMTSNRYAEPGALGLFDTLILDEAHDAADHLSDFVKIHLDYDDVRSLLGLELPLGVPIDEWVEWATREALPVCRGRLESAKTQASLYQHSIEVVRRLKEMEARIGDLASARSWQRTDSPDPPAWVPGTSTDWVIEETARGVVFSPVWASGYAESFLFNRIKRVVMLSATITQRDASYLGIHPSQFTYKAFPSPFKKSIRPVIVWPGASISRQSTVGELRMWLNKIDAIIEHEGSVKGIIHCVSYQRAKWLKQHSRNRDLMLVHERGTTRQTIEQFKSMPAPCILVSPSVETGYDFPYDQARYQIIAKIPFVDNRSLVLQARHKADKRYLDHVAVVRLIQMAGRGVRAFNDYCRTYIVDDNFPRWFYPRNRDLFPYWFKSAIRRIRSLSDLPRLPTRR